MSALIFDKQQLGNLEYSLQREMLSTDRIGGYMSTTIVGCNTRKYHGLMVSPIDDSGRDYVLLSSLDETIIQHEQSFNLALHRFEGSYSPRGHKYITDFEYTPTPTITYRVGGVVLRKELLWIHKRAQLMIRYTLVEARSETKLQLRPLLAFRDRHSLSKANMEANGNSFDVVNGVKCRLYDSFPWLYLQIDKDSGVEFVHAPDWYYNFEYQQELARGYDAYEDLMTNGYFEIDLKKGESVIFSASLQEMGSAKTIREIFSSSILRRTHKVDFLSCLEHSARQFLVRRGVERRAEIIAGYPWHGVSARQSFIALPGITLEQGNKEDCIDVVDNYIQSIDYNSLFETQSPTSEVDAPLWLFYTLQELSKAIGDKAIWERYSEAMKRILAHFRRGGDTRVQMHENGLIWAESKKTPLTWMNMRVDGRALTPRNGYQVEVNALWYNAICYALRVARAVKDSDFIKQWEAMPKLIERSFTELFTLEEGYLADFVDRAGANKLIRPNMIVACGLEYSPIPIDMQIAVIRTVEQHLLTPKGLRTLTPRSEEYRGSQFENPALRDASAMNGSVWTWLLSFYVAANFKVSSEAFTPTAERILGTFEDQIQSFGIGSIGEFFEADPPFAPQGAISQAWSVGALLNIYSQTLAHKGATKKGAPAKPTKKVATKPKTEGAIAKKTTTAKPKTKGATTKKV